MDFHPYRVETKNLDVALTFAGKPKRGFARIVFPDLTPIKFHQEVYDLRGGVGTQRQFQNWVKREFGYLRHDVEFG